MVFLAISPSTEAIKIDSSQNFKKLFECTAKLSMKSDDYDLLNKKYQKTVKKNSDLMMELKNMSNTTIEDAKYRHAMEIIAFHKLRVPAIVELEKALARCKYNLTMEKVRFFSNCNRGY
jgi:hypothetical protein